MTQDRRAQTEASFLEDYRRQERERQAEVQSGRQEWVARIKFDLRQEYALAKANLPKLESALAIARAFVERMNGTEQEDAVPQHLVRPQMLALGKYIEEGTVTIHKGLDAYDSLTFEQFGNEVTGDASAAASYQRQHVAYEIKKMLRAWDGRIEALTRLQGEVEHIIRNAPESLLQSADGKRPKEWQ